MSLMFSKFDFSGFSIQMNAFDTLNCLLTKEFQMLTSRHRIREDWFRITIIWMALLTKFVLEHSQTPWTDRPFRHVRGSRLLRHIKMIFWPTFYFSVVRQQTVEGEQEDARHGHQLRGPLHRRAPVLYDSLHGPQIRQHLRFGIKVSFMPFKSGNWQFLNFQLVFLYNFYQI